MISEALIDLQDDLNKMKTQLVFLFRVFAALSTDSVDKVLRPTEFEAFQGAMLGQEIAEKMIKRAEEALKEQLAKAN